MKALSLHVWLVFVGDFGRVIKDRGNPVILLESFNGNFQFEYLLKFSGNSPTVSY